MDHNTHAQSEDVSLSSTVREIAAECPKFRILVLGKTGCGKSSLINKVFGVDVAQVSHKEPGKADIETGFCPENNVHFILHDSQGFEPGETENFKKVETFIESRSKMPEIKDRLHAIWICISVPMAGDRVTETGVEKIVKMERGRVPLIVVFTKYDALVGVAIYNAPAELDDEEVQSYGENKASKDFRELCVDPLQETVGNVLLSKVSTQPRYRQLIEQLIEVTDEEVRRHQREPSHTEPVSLAWAIAQRGNSDTNNVAATPKVES